MELSSEEAVAYEDAVLAAIAKENRRVFENDRGLAESLSRQSCGLRIRIMKA